MEKQTRNSKKSSPTRRPPYVSVVIPSKDGAKRIGNTLSSLEQQDYPRNRYEIIVIDDGSVDDTAAVVSRYNVRLIKNKINRGIYVSRNIGLRAAKGTIIASTDDDCIIDRHWLSTLISQYTKPDVVAVGGVVLSQSVSTITEEYMFETGYGTPSPLEFRVNNSPIRRFLVYVKDMASPIIREARGTMQVTAIYTANASFRKELFNVIGDFDEDLKYSGDMEINMRIYNSIPYAKIMYTPKAIVIHKHRTKVSDLLKETFTRSKDSLQVYLKYRRIPALYPFPFLVVAIPIIIFIFFGLASAILTALFAPPVIYFWWLPRAVRAKKSYFLLFAYIQFLQEACVLIGTIGSAVLLMSRQTTKR